MATLKEVVSVIKDNKISTEAKDNLIDAYEISMVNIKGETYYVYFNIGTMNQAIMEYRKDYCSDLNEDLDNGVFFASMFIAHKIINQTYPEFAIDTIRELNELELSKFIQDIVIVIDRYTNKYINNFVQQQTMDFKNIININKNRKR